MDKLFPIGGAIIGASIGGPLGGYLGMSGGAAAGTAASLAGIEAGSLLGAQAGAGLGYVGGSALNASLGGVLSGSEPPRLPSPPNLIGGGGRGVPTPAAVSGVVQQPKPSPVQIGQLVGASDLLRRLRGF